jgi:serine protease Do
MSSRTRTVASFFTVAMSAMLLAAIVTTQAGGDARAGAPEPAPAAFAPAPAAAPQAASRATGALSLDTFQEVARLQTPAVVNINTRKTVRRRNNSQDPFRDFFGDDLMDRFFGPRRGEGQTQRSLGSGFIVSADGYILTNRHVVEGADEISVTLSNDRDYQAKLIGRDARTDVALLKIDAPNLTVLNMGDSDSTQVGEWVMAIGNPFGLGGNSVTVGVVSYKGRPLGLSSQQTPIEMLQTDASINPGNSGGPLINTRGEVIGINTLIITQGLPQSAGVGFAVPINVAKEILPQLRDKGRVIRGWMGVSIQAVTEDLAKTFGMPEARGAYISDVQEGSPAEKAGLKAEDVVVAVDGRPVEDNSDLSRYIASRPPGSTVRLRVRRDGGERDISVTLGTFPDEGEDGGDDAGAEGRARHGMSLRDLTPELADRLNAPRGTRGVVIMDVESGSNAEEAGLQRGDIIVSVNGQAVEDVGDFEAAVEKARADGVARVRIRRGQAHTGTILRLN